MVNIWRTSLAISTNSWFFFSSEFKQGKIPNLVLFLNPDALISFHNPNYKSENYPNYKSENWNRQSPSTVEKKTKGCKQRNPNIHAWKKLLTSGDKPEEARGGERKGDETILLGTKVLEFA